MVTNFGLLLSWWLQVVFFFFLQCDGAYRLNRDRSGRHCDCDEKAPTASCPDLGFSSATVLLLFTHVPHFLLLLLTVFCSRCYYNIIIKHVPNTTVFTEKFAILFHSVSYTNVTVTLLHVSNSNNYCVYILFFVGYRTSLYSTFLWNFYSG